MCTDKIIVNFIKMNLIKMHRFFNSERYTDSSQDDQKILKI